jgi:hypothetical protein
LISNYHVVKDATKVRLLTSAGLIDAKVVQVDAANDLALLKADGRFAPLPIAASRTVALWAARWRRSVFPTSDLTQRRKAAKSARQTPFILCALAPLRLCVDFPSRRRMRRCWCWFIEASLETLPHPKSSRQVPAPW